MNSESSNLRASVTRGLLWVGTGNFVGQLISWVSTIVVIRLLAPSDYGLMAMCASFVSFLQLISELGIGSSIVQAKEITTAEIRKVFGFVVLCSAVFLLIGHLGAPFVAQFYGEPRLTSLIRVMNLAFVLIGLYIVPQSIVIRQLNFRLKTQIDITSQVVRSVVTLVMALSGAGVWTLVTGPLVGHLLKAVCFTAFTKERVTPLFDLRSIKGFIRYGLTVTGDRLAFYCYSAADTVVIGRFLGNGLLGIYSVATDLAALPSEKLIPIITQVSFASYSRIQTERKRIGEGILSTIQAVSFVAFPVFFLMSATAPEAVALVLGAKWASIVVPFQILCLAMPLRALSPLLPPAVFATGKPGVNLVNMLISLAVMATAFLIGVNFGIIGVSLAWATAYPVVFLVTSSRSLNALGLRLTDMLKIIWFPFSASAVILLAATTLRMRMVMPADLTFMALLLLLGTIVYVGLALAFRRDECLRLKGFLMG